MPSVTFEELMRAGREMRRWQKTFFRSAKGAEKDLALIEARKWEKIFDALIKRDENKQLDIFSVLNAEDEAESDGRTCQRCGDPIAHHKDAIGFCSACLNAIAHEGNDKDEQMERHNYEIDKSVYELIPTSEESDTLADRLLATALRERREAGDG